MSRRSRRRSILALATLAVLVGGIVATLALRWNARKAALGYGLELQSVLFEEHARREEGQPRTQRDIFNEPRMLGYESTLRAPWNVVAVDYLERIEELRLGIVYLHVQLGQPTDLRFRQPPTLRHFKLEPGNRGDADVHRAIRTLMDDYLAAVGTR